MLPNPPLTPEEIEVNRRLAEAQKVIAEADKAKTEAEKSALELQKQKAEIEKKQDKAYIAASNLPAVSKPKARKKPSTRASKKSEWQKVPARVYNYVFGFFALACFVWAITAEIKVMTAESPDQKHQSTVDSLRKANDSLIKVSKWQDAVINQKAVKAKF